MNLDKIFDVAVLPDAPWRTKDNYSSIETCVDEIDAQVPFGSDATVGDLRR
jgi:hypothetical protein